MSKQPKPIFNPTNAQLEKWALQDARFIDALNKLPKSERLEAIKKVYAESVKSYLAKGSESKHLKRKSDTENETITKIIEVKPETLNPNFKPILNPTLAQLKQWVDSEQKFREALAKLPEHEREPKMREVYDIMIKKYFDTLAIKELLPRCKPIKLARFFHINEFIVEDLQNFKETYPGPPEDPKLIIILACMNLIIREEQGEVFQIIDPACFLWKFREPINKYQKYTDLFGRATSRLNHLINRATKITTSENLEELANALCLKYLGVNVIFHNTFFNTLINPVSLNEQYQIHKDKILTYYKFIKNKTDTYKL